MNGQTHRLSKRIKGSAKVNDTPRTKPEDRCPPHDFAFSHEHNNVKYYTCTKCGKVRP
jgi:hypothetical protein